VNLTTLIQIAQDAALKAGKEILRIYETADFGVEMKGDNSPLTLADQAAHQAIVQALEATQLPILSEEGRTIPYEERKAWEYFWMVDPLDGTKEFIKRNGEFTVNIALIHQERAIAGVLYAPVLDKMYVGIQGEGAWMEADGQKMSLTITQGQEVRAIVASRSHLSEETEDFIRQFPQAEAISMGSSLKFMLVAEGKAQLYPRFAPTMEWDTAAAQAIVEAAGGDVLAYPDLMPMRYNKKDLLNSWFLVR
jgi:3'(2'), 5'-bisphosphate nucleotidase